MAGLLEGVLPAVYSYGNTMQRKLKGLLADPLGTVGLGIIRAGEDDKQTSNLAYEAGYMPGSRSVLVSPEQKALARALLSQKMTEMGAGMIGATVWHGSPHKFDRFDSSKIGTGEGAQAYGHGLYLADSPEVSKTYMRTQINNAPELERMALRSGASPEAANTIAQWFYNTKKTDSLDDFLSIMKTPHPAESINKFRQSVVKQEPALRKAWDQFSDPGSLYKVDLPDPLISRMLDWDKPLSQQPVPVSNALKSMVDDVTSGRFDLSRGNRDIKKAFNPTTREQVLGEIVRDYPHLRIADGGLIDKSGNRVPDAAITEWMQNKHGIGYQDAGQLYRDLTHIVGNDAYVSSVLRNNGIPGIRYLDGGSRGAGAGTSNYVVFPGEESALTILERNGSPVNALVQALRGPR